MPVKEKLDDKPETETVKAPVEFNPSEHSGFHVVREDGTYLGTYETEVDATAFIDGHLTPQNIGALIAEGHDLPTEE